MNSDFACDSQFHKLLARNAEIDLTVAALEIARDAYPQLDFHETFRWIHDRATELAGPLAGAASERDALAALGCCLAGRYDICGDRESYDSADSSYLNRVIDRKRGIPISLSLLYMAVAEASGMTLQGVSSPGHFLTRYESVDGPLFVDAFQRGEILTYEECVTRFRFADELTDSQIESALEPAAPRTIIIRMLNNLKTLHARQSNWPAAWIVQHRLAALQPTAYSERRDLALISIKANRPGFAIDLLEACLRKCPGDETAVLEQQLVEAKKQMVRWN